MNLTNAKLRTLTAPGKHFDGGGLYLEITPAGGRYWRWKYRYGGKEKRLALGVYPGVSLKAARDGAAKAREVLQAGADPGELRKAEKTQAAHEAATSLGAVAAEWLEHQSERWEPDTKARIARALEADIFPTLGARPLASIKAKEIMAAVQRIEARGAGDQASRVLQRVKAMFRWAVVHHRIESNPLLDLVPSEVLKPREVNHRQALPVRELPVFLARLEAYDGDPQTALALRFLMLTATRPGETRGALWSEIDTDAKLWTIPAERMKMRNEHRVPLSRQALEVLEAARQISGGGALVFPSNSYRSKPLSANTFNSALARLGYKGIATSHGFRALFSSVANESGWDADVIERQLSHLERNRVRAAYHRSAYMDDRTRLMQWWADYVDERRAGNVVPLPQRVA